MPSSSFLFKSNRADVEPLCTQPSAVPGEDDVFEPAIPAADVPPASVPQRPEQAGPLTREEAAARIGELLDRMNGQRATLLDVLAFCSNPRTAVEVDACIEQAQALNRSVFSGASLRTLLQQAGALELVDEQGAPYVEKALEPHIVVVDGVECYEPQQPAEPLWRTTDAGVDVCAGDDPAARLRELFDDPDEQMYLPIYERVLTLCADDDGATTRSLGEAVDRDPLVQQPRYFVQHFVERLEQRGAVRWDGAAWKVTDLGMSALESLAKQA